MLIKKYGNRRLYDTQGSRYVTLEEVATKVHAGEDVRVVDAKTNADLTQVTLTQIILESRGASKLLPVPLLVQLIRMGDDALAEFFGRYVAWALEVYVQARQGAQVMGAPLSALGIPNPLSTFASLSPFGRMPWMDALTGHAPSTTASSPPPQSASSSDVADLRRELDELRRSMKPDKAPKPRTKRKR